jgi:hypothetical protein
MEMRRRKASSTKKVTHLAKPALSYFRSLFSDTEFKQQIEALRVKWEIEVPVKSIEEADKYWRNLCTLDFKEEDYIDKYERGETRSQLLKQDLEQLCETPNIKLPPDTWHVLYSILLCFDLEIVTDNDIFQLPLPPSLARISIAPSTFNPIQENHLYLDVTFASKEDIDKIWPNVSLWQRKVRPHSIKRGYLPDLLKDIKDGRPAIPDDICLQCVKLKEQGLTYLKIGEKYGWRIQLDAYMKRPRCRTAEEAVKKGRKLLT